LFGLSFQRYSRKDAKVSSRSPFGLIKFFKLWGTPPQYLPQKKKIGDERVGVSGLDDHVIHVGFNDSC
jgi:hypothetical protein